MSEPSPVPVDRPVPDSNEDEPDARVSDGAEDEPEVPQAPPRSRRDWRRVYVPGDIR